MDDRKRQIFKAQSAMIDALCHPKSRFYDMPDTDKLQVAEGLVAGLLYQMAGSGKHASAMFNDVLVTGIEQRIADIDLMMQEKANGR